MTAAYWLRLPTVPTLTTPCPCPDGPRAAASNNSIDSLRVPPSSSVTNIIAWDIPYLQSLNPHLRLLNMPVVDTLRLNPLAFPQRPYHRLVKHYKERRSGSKPDQ